MPPPASVSKSQFKARALELFRQVQQSGKPLVVTDRGRPVIRVAPFDEEPAALLRAFRGSVLRYEDPLAPVDADSWEAQR
jgi:prevent-host-death family protein